MAKVTVSLPQGTRDFNPETVRKRNYIFNTIREQFELFGFQPLETPAMENLETLMGKYGEEGDKLIFKILNNGLNDPRNTDKAKEGFDQLMQGRSDRKLTERALRYDLTIPFARYVAMNQGQLAFPFKRYQMQPVWRADKPQKGRYREFYQCDADVVGSQSLINETELAAIYANAFERLQIPVEIRINSRRLLSALATASGGNDKMTDITVAIDKLDKIGIDKVNAELESKSITADQIKIINQYLAINGTNEEKLAGIKSLLGNLEEGAKGIQELEYLLKMSAPNAPLVIDFTLARGLNYYTGIIFEVKAIGVEMGSIGGGGRYDDLTGLFGVPNIPGVGISFGVDRIYDVLETLGKFPADVHTGTQVLFFNLGEQESAAAFEQVQLLRANGVRSELYPDTVKFDKQFKYAEKKGIPFVAIIGTRELQESTAQIKDIRNGSQTSVPFSNLKDFLFI